MAQRFHAMQGQEGHLTSRSGWLRRLSLTFAVGLAVAGCSAEGEGGGGEGGGEGGETYTITGDLTGQGVQPSSNPGKCEFLLDTGMNHIRADTEVLVKDGGGETVGSGRLEEAEDSGTIPSGGYVLCRFTFEIPNVSEADFYEFQIGDLEGPTYSFAEMEDLDWHVALS
jgi:hypothetical protein